MKFPYKPNPQPDGTIQYLPIVQIQLRKGKATSAAFEAIVDSGSPTCLFNVGVARAIGIADITSGEHSTIGGIVRGAEIDLYAHDVRLMIGADNFRMEAYFSEELAIPGLLGRIGFFDKYTITFDPSESALEITRFHGKN